MAKRTFSLWWLCENLHFILVLCHDLVSTYTLSGHFAIDRVRTYTLSGYFAIDLVRTYILSGYFAIDHVRTHPYSALTRMNLEWSVSSGWASTPPSTSTLHMWCRGGSQSNNHRTNMIQLCQIFSYIVLKCVVYLFGKQNFLPKKSIKLHYKRWVLVRFILGTPMRKLFH